MHQGGGSGDDFLENMFADSKACDVEAKKRKLEAALLEITARERNAAMKVSFLYVTLSYTKNIFE